MSPENLAENSNEKLVKDAAAKLFDLVGFAEAGRPGSFEKYRDWIDGGRFGEMEYLRRHMEKKGDPALLLPGAKTWIVLGTLYDTAEPLSTELAATFAREKKGWIARYARGRDYHDEISEKHAFLISEFEKLLPGGKFLSCVDTKAVLERDAASRAGLGWVGKNTCLINEKRGSFLFLSEILTTAELASDKPVADHCGTCTRCLDACPTGALTGPRELDARLCISYWTIESKKPAPPALSEKFGAHVFGCDICQDVCPWNQKARRLNSLPEPRGSGLVDLRELVSMSDDEIKKKYDDTALSRAKPVHLRENAEVALRNLK